MMNRLTSVPTNIAPIIAMESGFCSSEPMSNENSSGTMANIVVSDVMMMGRSLLRPASWMASSNGIPPFQHKGPAFHTEAKALPKNSYT